MMSDRYAEAQLEDMRNIVREYEEKTCYCWMIQRLHLRPCQSDRQEVDPVEKVNV